MTRTAEQYLYANRGYGWAGEPCTGHVVYAEQRGVKGGVAFSLPEELLGPVGDGTIIKVTVEVVQEGAPLPTECANPWHRKINKTGPCDRARMNELMRSAETAGLSYGTMLDRIEAI